MSLAIRHGLTGEVVLNIDAVDVLPTGWEGMVQPATHFGLRHLSNHLVSNNTQDLPPRFIRSTGTCADMLFVIRPIQDPTAEQCSSMIEALCQKNAMALSILLGPFSSRWWPY